MPNQSSAILANRAAFIGNLYEVKALRTKNSCTLFITPTTVADYIITNKGDWEGPMVQWHDFNLKERQLRL